MRLKDPADADAWQEFVDVYSPLIYGYCRKRNVQAQDAADITQEVLLRVSRFIRDFQYAQERGMFRDWLAKIVRNELARYFGKQDKTQHHAETIESAEDNQLWQEHFHQHILSTALERTKPHFAPETWLLFSETWDGKKAAADIASSHGVTIEQVYVAKSRVLKRLRVEVNILAEDSP